MTHFHITDVKGLTQLEPHVPYGAEWGEPDVPRVCAAPTIEQCFLSLGDVYVPHPVVYAIDREPDVDNLSVAWWPCSGEVHDALVTGEVWYLTTVPCKEV